MATASKIDLSDAAHLAFAVPDRKAESARTTSELLQESQSNTGTGPQDHFSDLL